MAEVNFFDLTFPDNALYTINPTPFNLTIYSFQTTAFLSIFSGLFIEATSGSTMEDCALIRRDSSKELAYCLTLVATGSSPIGYIEDTTYEIVVGEGEP